MSESQKRFWTWCRTNDQVADEMEEVWRIVVMLERRSAVWEVQRDVKWEQWVKL